MANNIQPANDLPVFIMSDSPARESGLFGFDAYAKTIAELIAYKENKTPLVIGIYGPWGSGKTTLMQTVIGFIEKTRDKDPALYRSCKTVWFQAWKYREEDQILAALLEEILKSMKNAGFFQACKAEIEGLIKRFQPAKVVATFSKLLVDVDVAQFFADLPHRGKLGFYDTFQEFFDRLLWTYLNWRPQQTASEKTDDSQGALVVFVDDLDRCPKERILKVLETIKLFMDKPGCIFVIGAANDIIDEALKPTYGQDAGKFMDKIVQVTFNLPQIPAPDFTAYVKRIIPGAHDDLLPNLPLILPAMQNNPRRVKRFLNNLSLQAGLLRNRAIPVTFKHLLYWSIIDYAFPLLRDDLKDRPQLLFTLQEHIRNIDAALPDQENWEITQELLDKVPQSLRVHVQRQEVSRVVRHLDIKPAEFRQLITLCQMVESKEEAKEKEVRQGLAALDEMVKVAAGEFLYGEAKQKERIEQPFLNDVYPVTNSQYKKFVEDGGYAKDQFWSEAGRSWRTKNGVTEPQYWQDEKWNQPEHPVVGVSFYEAEAYAKWAGKRLPTEEEWERAARGVDGRMYPWGDEFDQEKCNTSGAEIGGTSRVTRYPEGMSPAGCYDMAGNVWEWTDAWYDNDKDERVLRGGSWNDAQNFARCAIRFRFFPNYRYNIVGFRCARTLN